MLRVTNRIVGGNKMKIRRIFAMLVSLAMCVALISACAGGGDSGPIKIGIIGPFTGAVAQYGEAVRDGAILYLEQVNERGGIDGREIEWVLYDMNMTRSKR